VIDWKNRTNLDNFLPSHKERFTLPVFNEMPLLFTQIIWRSLNKNYVLSFVLKCGCGLILNNILTSNELWLLRKNKLYLKSLENPLTRWKSIYSTETHNGWWWVGQETV
jgi:hypothetical protein